MPIVLLVLGIAFGLTALLTLASIFFNLPGPLGKWFGKKNENKLFFLINSRGVRGLINLLLLPLPEKYHPTGARIVAAVVAGLACFGVLFYQ